MRGENLENTVVVVTAGEKETEVKLDLCVGNLDQEASECFLIGRAVRAALMASNDGDVVEVCVYSQ